MSFYNLGGTVGALAHYDVYGQKQTAHRRWILVGLLIAAVLSVSTLVTKTSAGAEQADLILPDQNLAAVSPQSAPVPETPVLATVTDRSPELQAELEAWTAKQAGSEWSFYVRSLDNDELNVGVNDTKQLEMASIYKLFLLKPLAQKVPAGSWASTVITDRSYLECVQVMLSVSDNNCAEAIAGSLGWTAMHRQNIADGYKHTVINREDFFVSSVADTGLLLDRLYHGDGYDAKTKETALVALGEAKATEAIRRACPSCAVYNKTGDLKGYKHDAAIVEKDGKPYVVVIFSKGAAWAQLAEAAALINNRL